MVSPPVETLGAPVRVSPFVRFCRWSFLLMGIAYGSKHWYTIKKRDDEEKAYIAKMKPIWMEQKRQHLNKLNRQELLYLAKETGVKVSADFDQQYPPN